MSRLALLLILIFLMVPVMAMAQAPLIAVLPIEEGDLSWKGFRSEDILNGISQLITDKLVEMDGIRVVERTRILDILDEQDFASSRRVDPETAAQIGRILGVDALILTTLTRMEVGEKGGVSFGPLSVSGVTAHVVLTGRVVDATTAEIKASYQGEGKATEASLNVSDVYGLSFGTKAFQDSVLGKSINEAVDDFASQIIKNPKALLTRLEILEGKVVGMVGAKVIIDIGARDGVRLRQQGKLVRLVGIEGVENPVAVPIGKIEVTSVNEETAIIDAYDLDDEPKVGDYVQLETMVF